MLSSALAAGVVALLLLRALQCLYNITLHPLARFPGPLAWRASRLPWVWALLRGRLPRDVLALHQRHGPVVRIAPDELSFVDARAWPDIYGHRPAAQAEMHKHAYYYRTPPMPPSILSESGENHAALRRQLVGRFSERTLRAQGPIIGGYVDLLVRRLREQCGSSVGAEQEEEEEQEQEEQQAGAGAGTAPHASGVVDLTAWYTWTTFDIIGDLALGEPFGCLRRARYDAWVAAISQALRLQAGIMALKYTGLGWLAGLLVRYGIYARRRLRAMMQDKLDRRIAAGAERPDLIEGLLDKKDEWHLSPERLRLNATTLVIAGSETTATLLAGATYLLLTHPPALARAAAEVRAVFASDAHITLASIAAAPLPFLLACLNEALRLCPPVPAGLPRVVPPGGATVAGVWVPGATVVGVWQWAANHASENWADPFAFRPERFLRRRGQGSVSERQKEAVGAESGEEEAEEFARDKAASLQPFSVGPRNCIGKNLAYAEMRLVLARMLYNFDMELAGSMKGRDWLDQKMYVVWSKGPLEVRLTPVR